MRSKADKPRYRPEILATGLILILVSSAFLASAPNRSLPAAMSSTTLEPQVPGSQRPEVLWRAGFESGDTGEFFGVSTSDCASAEVVGDPVHTGTYAGALSVCEGRGGVRMRVEGLVPGTSLPDDAYYSAWFLMPTSFTGDDSNIFQFKQAVTDDGLTQTKEVLFSIQVGWEVGHGWDLRLKGKIDQEIRAWDNVQRVLGHSGAAGIHAPANRWFQIETRYVWSKGGAGRIATWLDGQLLWDFADLTTEIDWPYLARPRQWTMNHYAKGITPPSSTIYLDDATVSFRRLTDPGK